MYVCIHSNNTYSYFASIISFNILLCVKYLVLYIANISSESPLPPTSLTSVPSDTSISLMWSHSDECFENCTFMYEVTWQQSGDGSSLRNTTTTETSYSIEVLTPGTSYEIGVGAYCNENVNISSKRNVTVTTTSSKNFIKLSTVYFFYKCENNYRYVSSYNLDLRAYYCEGIQIC